MTARKNHCRNGHNLMAPGAVAYWSGRRWCRLCHAAANKRNRTRLELAKAAKAEHVDYTDRILRLGVELESAMPWERDRIVSAIASLREQAARARS